MTPNNNLSVLPFYDSLERQNHRKDYAFGNIFPLFAPANILLPFQIMTPRTSKPSFIDVHLNDRNGKDVMSLTSAMKEVGLTFVPLEEQGIGIIVFPAILPMATDMRDGVYYLTVYDNTQTYYSEMFTVVQNVEKYMKIEWWDEENLLFDAGAIIYNNPNFKNRVYLCSQLARPDYNFEEEGEDRDGYFFPAKQLSEKVYKFNFLAPEYLLDAMRLIRMADHVEITNKGETFVADSFLITPTWEDQGDLAGVDAEFETSTVVKKIGRGELATTKGDFNADYNNDYLKE